MSENRPVTEFQFVREIPIDIANTLSQLLGTFQSVRDGLPELPKNSKDHYSRLGVTAKEDRQILILVNSKTASVGVLDFAGASKEDFAKWVTWSDPNASGQQSADIEGGHGNGGKAFMVSGSKTESFIESVSKGRRTKMGYKNDSPARRYYPAHIKEDSITVDDIVENNPRSRLDAVLSRFRTKFNALPRDAQRIFDQRKAFTLVEIQGVRDWSGRRDAKLKSLLSELPGMLRHHSQMASTLESCTVSLMIDGQVTGDSPLTMVYPDPMPGFEEIIRVPVPKTLLDPETGDQVITGGIDGDLLTLRTSKKHLRQTEKTLNVLRVRNRKNVVATLSIAELAPQNESAFIFGELKLGSIEGEHLSGADRKGLADTSLTRAVRHWASEQIDDLSEKLRKALAKDHREQDRTKANDSLSKMRELMRRFLDQDDDGSGGEEENGRRGEGSGGDINPPPPPHTRGKRVTKIVLEPGRDTLPLAAGSSIPLIVRYLEVTKSGEELPMHPSSATPALVQQGGDVVCRLDESGVLHVSNAGRCTIAIRDAKSGVTSNTVEIESIGCSGVDFIGVDRILLKGERIALAPSFHSEAGPRQGLLIDATVDEIDRGRISRTGIFTCGQQEGEVTVRVRYGPRPGDTSTLVLRVGLDAVPPRRKGGSQGAGDIPYILLCGTTAPGMEDLPPQQRTHSGGEIHPTIIEEPPFDNVVWINPNSKEALRVRQGRGGTKGSAGIATKTFGQFVAMKAFDILKRLRVRQEIGETSVNELQFRNQLAMAEMACADFVEGAWAIADDIANSEQAIP